MAMKAVNLTHVRYERGDRLGQLMALASLLPVFMSFGGFTTHFLFRRELQTFFFAGGMLLSEVVNQVIKKTVKEARPPTCQILEACDSHGWPSSHSQYMCFFSIYLTLLVTQRWHFSSPLARATSALAPWPATVLVMASRVYLGYHTFPQIVAGATLGLVLGALYFSFVDRCIVPLFPAIQDWSLCRFFLVKDSSHIPDVLAFEYEQSRAARKQAVASTKKTL